MKQDKVIVEKGFFVQVVVSLIMTGVYFKDFLHAIWSLPVMIILVIVVNCYFNALSVGYKLKSKTLKLQWAFFSPFVYTDRPRFLKRLFS